MACLVICANCGEGKPHEAKGLCRLCYDRQREQEHPRDRRAYNRRYNQEHPRDRRAYARRYREENREKILADNHRRYLENQEENRARSLAWAKNNPEKKAAKYARREAQKRRLPDTLTIRQAVHLFTIGQAMYPDERLHLDHIVPLSKGGGTTLANMHAIPARLNCSKNDALPQEVYKQELMEV